MKNVNCLADIMCPKCAHTKDFIIGSTTLVYVTDDGAEPAPHTDIEWDEDSFIQCKSCSEKGTVGKFMIPGFNVTFQTTTPDSEEHGDSERSGWWMPGGWMHDEYPDELAFEFDPDDFDPEEHPSAQNAVIDWAVNLLKQEGATHGSCHPPKDAEWWSTESEVINYDSDELITKSFHFERFTAEQIEAINLRMAGES